MFDMMFFLAQLATKEPKGQSEYAQAWALVGILMFLGLLVVMIPRPRLVDIRENEQKNREKSHGGKGHSSRGASSGSRSGPVTSFQSALQQNRQK